MFVGNSIVFGVYQRIVENNLFISFQTWVSNEQGFPENFVTGFWKAYSTNNTHFSKFLKISLFVRKIIRYGWLLQEVNNCSSWLECYLLFLNHQLIRCLMNQSLLKLGEIGRLVIGSPLLKWLASMSGFNWFSNLCYFNYFCLTFMSLCILYGLYFDLIWSLICLFYNVYRAICYYSGSFLFDYLICIWVTAFSTCLQIPYVCAYRWTQ